MAQATQTGIDALVEAVNASVASTTEARAAMAACAAELCDAANKDQQGCYKMEDVNALHANTMARLDAMEARMATAAAAPFNPNDPATIAAFAEALKGVVTKAGAADAGDVEGYEGYYSGPVRRILIGLKKMYKDAADKYTEEDKEYHQLMGAVDALEDTTQLEMSSFQEITDSKPFSSERIRAEAKNYMISYAIIGDIAIRVGRPERAMEYLIGASVGGAKRLAHVTLHTAHARLRGLAKRQPVVGQAIGLRVRLGAKQAHKKATKPKKLSIGASLASVLRLGTASKKPKAVGADAESATWEEWKAIEAAIEKLVQQIRDETDPAKVTALEAELREYAEALVVSMAVDIYDLILAHTKATNPDLSDEEAEALAAERFAKWWSSEEGTEGAAPPEGVDPGVIDVLNDNVSGLLTRLIEATTRRVTLNNPDLSEDEVAARVQEELDEWAAYITSIFQLPESAAEPAAEPAPAPVPVPAPASPEEAAEAEAAVTEAEEAEKAETAVVDRRLIWQITRAAILADPYHTDDVEDYEEVMGAIKTFIMESSDEEALALLLAAGNAVIDTLMPPDAVEMARMGQSVGGQPPSKITTALARISTKMRASSTDVGSHMGGDNGDDTDAAADMEAALQQAATLAVMEVGASCNDIKAPEAQATIASKVVAATLAPTETATLEYGRAVARTLAQCSPTSKPAVAIKAVGDAMDAHNKGTMHSESNVALLNAAIGAVEATTNGTSCKEKAAAAVAGALSADVPRTDAYERCKMTEKIAAMAMNSHMLGDTKTHRADIEQAVARESYNQTMAMGTHTPGHKDTGAAASSKSVLSKLLW